MAITLQDIIDLAGANTEYTATMTTNEIYFCANTEERFTDTLAMIASAILGKAAINHTHTGFSLVDHVHTEYADADHTHTGYAASAHTHTPASIGAATADHTHTGYAASNHTHDYADSAHTHTPASIGAATADHSHSGYASADHSHTGYAASSHTHEIANINGLQTALNGKETSGAAASALTSANNYTDTKIADLINSAPSTLDTLGEIAAAMEDNAEVVEALETAIGSKAAANHTHTPASIGAAASDHTHTAASVGAAASNHTHTPAAIGAAAASHGHSYNDLSDKPTIPAAYTHPSTHPASMITGLAGVATSGSYNDLTNKPTIPAAYTHPSSHPASMITGLSDVATSGSYNDLSDKPTIPTIPSALPANGGNADTVDNKHASDFATADHTHTAAALIAMASALFGMNSQGGVEYSYGSDSGKNALTEISNMPQGFHTIYSIAGTAGNPETTESYRYYLHKTSGTIGWILAFGADGSIYSNYQSAAGTFKGWRTIHDTKRKPLWTGSYYMTAGHTATPSKKLSQCEHGWLLLWSDYDPDTGTVNNSDFCTTMIPNRSWAGATWNGSSFYCDVPRYSAGTATDSESRVIKVLTVYDNKLVGSDNNNAAPRNDVVLRAVYEF